MRIFIKKSIYSDISLQFLLFFFGLISNCHALVPGLYCGKESCYDVLNVTRDTPKSELGKAYRKLAAKFHPDRHRTEEAKKEAEERFRIIAVAYETLKDEESRKNYDYLLDHPEEYYKHYYYYYRNRVAPKVDIRLVIVATILIISLIQYISARHKYEDAVKYLLTQPKYRLKAMGLAQERGLLDDDKKKTKKKKKEDKADLRQEEDAVIRSIIEENVDIRGGYKRPSIFDTLVFQIFYVPYYLYVYVSWFVRWHWKFTFKKEEYGDEERAYLIRRNLKLTQAQYDNPFKLEVQAVDPTEATTLLLRHDELQKQKEEEKKRKEEEKKRKDEEKKARQDARRTQLEEMERRQKEIEQEERRREEEDYETRKRDKKAKKEALQKERQFLQEFAKECRYFNSEIESADRAAMIKETDRLCQFLSLERLQSLNEQLRATTNNATKSKRIFDNFVDELNKEELENRKDNEATEWSHEESQLLVKAMIVFPVGTKSRWDVVAAFINEHGKNSDEAITTTSAKPKTAKDVVRKVKELEKLDDNSKELAAKGQVLKTKSDIRVEAPLSLRTEAPGDIASTETSKPWTADEQKIFEQALRTFPSDLGQWERWEKVAECLPGRTKKECVQRFKELTELVRAKKAALQKVEKQQQKKTNDTTNI